MWSLICVVDLNFRSGILQMSPTKQLDKSIEINKGRMVFKMGYLPIWDRTGSQFQDQNANILLFIHFHTNINFN